MNCPALRVGERLDTQALWQWHADRRNSFNPSRMPGIRMRKASRFNFAPALEPVMSDPNMRS